VGSLLRLNSTHNSRRSGLVWLKHPDDGAWVLTEYAVASRATVRHTGRRTAGAGTAAS